MTTEQKAKAYDEALNWMRKLYPGLHGATKEDAEHYFPELRESENERIRKDMCVWLKHKLETCTYPTPKKETLSTWISYLEKQKDAFENGRQLGIMQEQARQELEWPDEKQKEQKPISFNEPYNPDDYEVVMEGNATSLRRKEQKLTEWSEDCCEENIQTRFAFYTYKDDPSTLYLSNVFVEEASRNHGFGTRILRAAEKVAETVGATTISLKVKQDSPANAWYRKHGYGYVAFEDGYDWLEKNLEYLKPTKSAEWSEEDEKIAKEIEEELWYPGDFPDYPSKEESKLYDDCQRRLNWFKNRLKSLRPQPKAELTLLDENIIKAAVAFVEQNDHFNCWGGIDKHTVIKALRSLKPHWKPSEEQVKALKIARNFVVDDFSENPTLSEILKALQEQLEKQM